VILRRINRGGRERRSMRTTQGRSVIGDNDDDGGRRLEKLETKPTNRTGNQSATIWP